MPKRMFEVLEPAAGASFALERREDGAILRPPRTSGIRRVGGPRYGSRRATAAHTRGTRMISLTDYFRDYSVGRAVEIPPREYERYFRSKPRPAEQTRVAATTTRSSARRPPQRFTEVQLLRDQRPIGRLSLIGRGWEDVLDQVDETLRQWELTETGGWLLVDPQQDPRRVLRATGPGGGRASYDSIKITLRDRVEIGRFYPWLKPIGTWHTHPSGGSEPSKADLRIARNQAEAGNGNHLDLVVVPGELGFRTPKPYGWWTHQRDGNWVCEPLSVFTH